MTDFCRTYVNAEIHNSFFNNTCYYEDYQTMLDNSSFSFFDSFDSENEEIDVDVPISKTIDKTRKRKRNDHNKLVPLGIQTWIELKHFIDEKQKNLDYEKTIKEMITCPIHQDIMIDPVVLPCGHTLCNDCLSNGPLRSVSRCCPLCKKRIKRSMEFPTNFVIKSYVDQFVVRCPFIPCEHISNIWDISAHAEYCMYQSVPCPNKINGCFVNSKKMDIEQHLQQCEYYVCKNASIGCGLRSFLSTVTKHNEYCVYHLFKEKEEELLKLKRTFMVN